MQSTLTQSEAEVWTQLAPLLDDALNELGETDRAALVLRYFENRTAREIAAALRMEEAAAQKRVARALDKLRTRLAQRGAMLTTTMIAAAVAANAVQAAPAGLVATISAVALTKGAAAGVSTLALVKGALKILAWTKVKMAVVVGAGVLLAAGTTTVMISSPSQDPEAAAILKRVCQKYASLSSYNSTGKTVEEIDNETVTASFSMRLGRANYYHVKYEQHGPTFTNKGTLWSDGSGDYFANDITNRSAKPPVHGLLNTDEIKWPTPGPARNLGGFDFATGGASIIVPAMFFDTKIAPTTEERAWCRLVQPAVWGRAHLVKNPEEKVGELDCYVLSAITPDGTARLWVGKDDYLIHKSQQEVKTKLTDITEAEVVAMLNATPGKPPLPAREIRQQINAARKAASAAMQPVKITFPRRPGDTGLDSMTIQPPGVIFFTQMYENIVVNQDFSASDFAR